MLHASAVVGLAGAIAAGIALGDVAIAILGPRRARRATRRRPPSRRRRAAWLAATAACRRALPWTVVGAGATAALSWGMGAAMPAAAAAVAAIAAGAGAVGGLLLLVAGRIESRGSRSTGRALARLAGQIAFFGAAVFALVDGASHVVSACLVALGGSAALLAGLAGKPRPSGALALVLCGAGLVSLVVF